MSNNLTKLNNTGNDVTFSVSSADNSITVILNPDRNPDGQFVDGSVTALKIEQLGMAVSLSDETSLEGYLDAFASMNPGINSIVMTVTTANYQGGGQFNWKITGAGITLPEQSYSLQPWTSRLDSFVINIR